jgi:hypothetical protein
MKCNQSHRWRIAKLDLCRKENELGNARVPARKRKQPASDRLAFDLAYRHAWINSRPDEQVRMGVTFDL